MVLSLSFSQNQAQGNTDETGVISGTVTDMQSGDPLEGSNLILQGTQLGDNTGASGNFRIEEIPPDTYTLQISYLGFQTKEKEITIEANEQKSFEFELQPEGVDLEQIVVTSERQQEELGDIGRSTMSVDQIIQSPGVLQDDVFRSMQLLPGVSAASDFSSGLYIRGGSPDQTLIQLDHAPVYNPTHFFGFFSTFNADAIEDVDLYKGTYPAEYGGRLGSVVDLTNRSGDTGNHGGNLNLGLLSSRIQLEGPAGEGSYLIAFRRSTLEPLLAAMRDQIDEIPDSFYFYDLNAGLNYDIDQQNRLRFNVYSGADQVEFPMDSDDEFQLNYGNRMFSSEWRHIVDSDLVGNLRLTGSQYFNRPYFDSFGSEYERENELSELSLQGDLQWLISDAHEVTTGLSTRRMNFSFRDTFDDQVILGSDWTSYFSSVFLQHEWRPASQWRINSGLRAEHFSLGNHWRLGPRLSVDYFMTDRLRLQAGYGRYFQYLTLLTSEAFSGFDVWIPAVDGIEPSYGDQFAAGFRYNILDDLEFELEGYFRTMNDLFEIDPFLNQTEAGQSVGEEFFRVGQGYAYGLELMLERSYGIINGFIGYTYGQTRRQFPDFNDERFFHPRYDRTHDVTAVINYEISRNWELSSAFTYQTGQAHTVPTHRTGLRNSPVENSGTNTLVVDQVNNSRLPAYHRLDLSATRQGEFFGFADSELQLQVINAYSRRNTWFMDYNYDENPPEQREVPMLPIIPSVTYSVSF